MALNWIFALFFILSFIAAIIQFFGGNIEIFTVLMNGVFSSAKEGINLCIAFAGYITLFQGLMHIGEKGGLIQKLSKITAPFFQKIFPEVPKDHPAMGSILLNFSANALNLGNAATPFGLKAMEQLQELNPQKSQASNSQIMFLVLNTSGLTLIPIAIMALRFQYHSVNPSDLFIPVLLTTFCSTLFGLLFTSFIQKINLFQPVILLYFLAIAIVLGTFVSIPIFLSAHLSEIFVQNIGGFLLLFIFVFFISHGLIKKINVYDAFIEGAKSGVNTALKIAPYLIGIMVAISLFKNSGILHLLIAGIKQLFNKINTWEIFTINTDFVDALPVALMRPLSGSGAEAMVITLFNEHGVDSFAGKLASLFQGSSETTFYVLAVYFGAVGISKTRYAVSCGLFADIMGAISAIFFAYIFFT